MEDIEYILKAHGDGIIEGTQLVALEQLVPPDAEKYLSSTNGRHGKPASWFWEAIWTPEQNNVWHHSIADGIAREAVEEYKESLPKADGRSSFERATPIVDDETDLGQRDFGGTP